MHNIRNMLALDESVFQLYFKEHLTLSTLTLSTMKVHVLAAIAQLVGAPTAAKLYFAYVPTLAIVILVLGTGSFPYVSYSISVLALKHQRVH